MESLNENKDLMKCTQKVVPTNLRRFTFIMKYSKEFKLECVMKYKNGEHIKDPPGTKHRHFYKQVLKWVQQYDSLGELALEHNRPTSSILV